MLLPPQGEESGETEKLEEAKYVLKYAPGPSLIPGYRPWGIGEPLKGLDEVIEKFEERFPDTRIEVINVPVNLREFLVTQLSSGAAPDIVTVNVEDVWVDVQKGWYVPLDGYLNAPNPFVMARDSSDVPGSQSWWDMFKYQALSRGKAAPDGNNYCLTLSAVETGIFYNKTLFEEYGLVPPKTWAEFISIMEVINEHDKTPLLITLKALADWGTDLVFDQLYYDLLPGIDLKKDPTREAYLQGYLDGDELYFLSTKGFFSRDDPRFAEMAGILKELRPFLPRDMVSMSENYMREFLTQSGVMMWGPSEMTYPLWVDKDLGFEWGVFYLPEITEATSVFAADTPMCVIGGAAHQLEVTNSALKDTDPSWPLEERMEKSERLERVISFLQFLSLPENVERVVNEYPAYLPNIVGVEGLAPLKPFDEILKRRYTTTKWVYSYDLRFTDIMNRMLGLYLEDGADLEGFLKWQEGNILTAGESLVRRQNVDLTAFEKRWDELAPLRAKMKGVPEGAKAD